jgi:ABC-type glycerol-3-phosphate transport system substrate-binding protein
MNRCLILTLQLLALCGLAGCPSDTADQPTTELPLVGQTVEVVAPADLALKDLWQPLIAEWKAQTGGDVTWSEYAADERPWNGDETPSAANGGRLTIAALTDLPDAESRGFFAPAPIGVLDRIDQRDLLPGLKNAVLSREKRLVAIPVSAPVMLCYYRQDLLDAAGRIPPTTWDEYQSLVDDLPQWAPGLAGLEPCGPDFRATLFLARSTAFVKHPDNYSAWFDIQTGLPLFDSPAFERSLETARKAWSKMPETIWQMSPADCRRELLAGKAALIVSFEPLGAYPTSPGLEMPASGAPPAIGVCPLPGTTQVYQRDADRWEAVKSEGPYQPGLVGFSGLVIGVSATAERPAAWNLLETLSAKLATAFAGRPRSVCRESESLAGFSSGDLNAETEGLVTDAVAQTLRSRATVAEFAVPDAAPLRTIIAEELAVAQDPQRETKAILAAIQNRLVEATESHRDSLRDAYRRAVGLAPQTRNAP